MVGSAPGSVKGRRLAAPLHECCTVSVYCTTPPYARRYIGSSGLSKPLYRYKATAVFPYRAHHGALGGKTGDDIPVYNVALPLVQRRFPGGPLCRVVEAPLQ
jgi:hypothetical protein